jgi:hypothetical protein
VAFFGTDVLSVPSSKISLSKTTPILLASITGTNLPHFLTLVRYCNTLALHKAPEREVGRFLHSY